MTSLCYVAQSEAFPCGENVRVVGKAAHQGWRRARVAEHCVPLPKLDVRRDDDTVALVTCGHDHLFRTAFPRHHTLYL